MVDCDVLIVGAGAAGLTAAVYTCRKQLKTIIVSLDVGGQTNLTNHIENYPGVDAQPGPVLMQKFLENATGFGAELKTGKITKVEKKKDNSFVATVDDESQISCRALILAFGKVPRKLNIPGEQKFFGRGLATCVTCDAPLFKKKIVAVIGGGNAAVEGALELAEIASKVYLVHRRNEYRADEITVAKLKEHSNIIEVKNHDSVEVKGDKFVTGLVVKDNGSGTQSELKVDGVFSEIGHEADVSAVQHLVKTNEQHEIIVDERGKTSCSGIFAAGDITPVPYKQTVIAAGHGAIAALEAHRWLSTQKKR